MVPKQIESCLQLRTAIIPLGCPVPFLRRFFQT
jgi:hypothetical protein